MIGVLAVTILGGIGLLITYLSLSLVSANKSARRSAYIAGQCMQALTDAATSPLVDQSTASDLSLKLHGLRKTAAPLISEGREIN